MKKVAAAIIGLVFVVAAVWLWQARGGSDSAELVLHGNVDVRQISLAFEGTGSVRAMTADEGNRVRQGDTLARLETTKLTLQAEQATGQERNREGEGKDGAR